MRALAIGSLLLSALLITCDARAQQGQPRSPAICMTAVEFKGATTSDKVPPPPLDPTRASRGYAYKAPGQANPADPKRWEVASYQFSPAFVTVQQGDSIMLSAFVANGDHHQVQLIDPDGAKIIDNAGWDRGREYTILVLPR